MTTAQEFVERALELSSTDGCIVIAAEHTETNLRFANNKLTTNGQMTSRSLTVISTVAVEGGTAAGVITRSVTTLDELADAVRASEAAARSGDPAEDATDLVAAYESGDDWDQAPATTSVEVFRDFAPALGRAFATAADRGRLLFGFAEHQLTSTFVGTSTGLRRRFDQPAGRIELNAKSADFTNSAWTGAHTRDFTDVDIVALADGLHTRLDWGANRVELPAGRYETLLSPTAVADLMIYTYWAFSARDAEEGRSVFAASEGRTRLGEQLSALPITLRSDPAEPGLQCAPFEVATASDGGSQSVFDNGAPIRATDWIAGGQLANLARTRAWAARSDAEPRYFIGNLTMEAQGTATLEQMIASTKRGLLLTCLWYIREVDPQTLLLTGLTRDGVYLIEDGQVVGAVNNFRFNESPVDLLGRVTEAGARQFTLPREWGDWFVRAAMPPLRVPDFNMSTVSQAS